jgi:hypothetical protein
MKNVTFKEPLFVCGGRICRPKKLTVTGRKPTKGII